MLSFRFRCLRLPGVASVRAVIAVLALASLALSISVSAQVPTFNTVLATPTGSAPWLTPRPAAVGDFNGDGKLDALIVDGTASARFMRGNGDSTFAEINIDAAQMTTSNMVNLPAGLAQYMPQGIDGYVLVKAADVNGDGKLDAVCVTTVHINWGPYSLVTVLTNTGNDANGVPQFATTNYFLGFYDVRSLTVGDLNADGRSDIIVGSAFGGLYIYKNNGDGTFAVGQVTTILPNNGNPAVGPGVIADVNGDGKADFVVTSGQANATDVLLGNGDGTLQTASIVSPAASCIAVADLNKDGKPDLIEGLADGSVSVLLGNGNGTFGSATNFASGASSSPSGFFVSDVNGDSNLDVAASLPVLGKVATLTGNGTGALSSPYLYGSIPSIQDVTLADFTGDGKPEIGAVSANGYGGQNFDVLTNTTVFAPPLQAQTLTILGGLGNVGAVAPNVEYYNPATGNWQPAYLADKRPQSPGVEHDWGVIAGTNHWINYRSDGSLISEPGAGPTTNQTLWYLYRVRFTVPSDAVDPKMTFSVKADNFAQVAINGVAAGGTPWVINNAIVNNVIEGQANQLNADAVFSQAVHPGENTITINVGDYGGLNGFNFRIDLSMKASQPLEIVTPPVVAAPVVASGSASGTYGTPFTYTISATNSPESYGATGLPAGLSRNGAVISGTPTQTGTFSVGLSATNAGGTGNGTLTLTIGKATASIALADLAQTYDGTVKSASATTTPAGLNVIFNYVGARINAGSYEFLASISDPNYTGSKSDTLVIAKATASVTVNGYTGTYDGAAHGATGTATGVGGVSLPGLTLGATYTDYPGGTASWSFDGGTNYNSTSGSAAIVINKADASIAVAGYTGTYDGLPHGATGSATGIGGVNLAGLDLGASFTNAPGGTANWTFSGGTNYKDRSGTAAITIAKANATVVVTPYDVEFDNVSHSATIASITGVHGETGATVGTVALTTTHTEVGTFSDSWSFTGGTNYNNIGSTPITDKITDTIAPAIGSVTPSSATLWPPNHQMVPIQVSAAATDVAGIASLKIISVSSNEPQEGLGDGDMPIDWVITGDLSVNLRAERGGKGNGRIYTITVEAKDNHGLKSTKTCTVSVAQDQRK